MLTAFFLFSGLSKQGSCEMELLRKTVRNRQKKSNGEMMSQNNSTTHRAK